MTIALGITCTDGVVIAADTQESYGYLKVDQGKIVPVVAHGGSCAIAGAGDSGYIDALTIALAEALPTKSDATPKVAVAHLQKRLKQFYALGGQLKTRH